jgi:hypothetical protein
VRQQTIPTFLLSSVVPKNYRYIWVLANEVAAWNHHRSFTQTCGDIESFTQSKSEVRLLSLWLSTVFFFYLYGIALLWLR